MSTTPRRTRARGSRVVLHGRYRVDGVIARGGMSVVHRGMDLRLDRPVAIKILDGSLAEDPAFVRRFEREARAAARLAHPGIVAVHDQDSDDDGTIFLVLELVEGGTLRDVLREHGRLRPATALTVVEQVVTALQVAHQRGLVHRDVKPENVLVSASGAVKVADFGLVGAAWDRAGASGATGDRARASGATGDRARASGATGDRAGASGATGEIDDDGGADELILGTAAYLSPEQVADGHADARSDLYAAGIVLFELLTGSPPHGGDTAAAVASAHVHRDVPPPSRFVPVPRALDALVLASTRRDPARRPADAAAFLAEARRVRASSDLPFLPVPAPPVRGPRDEDPDDDSAASPPRGGTRRLSLDVSPGRRRRYTSDDPDDEWDESGRDADDEDPDDEWDAAGTPRHGAVVDDVDDRIERLARRRARTRSRRVFAAWVVGCGAATVTAAMAGWNAGLPVP